jgi:hypothetical protein
MHKEHEDRIDPNVPSLIVVYGRTSRKVRPLVGDLVVVGRGPGCDLGLVSPEVAPVHCVIVRLADGWRIRDCSGRATRLNGHAIRDEPLRNGDTIQVGTFSFEARLPAHPVAGAPAAVAVPAPLAVTAPTVAVEKLARLERSRRRLAEHALRLRRQLSEREEDQEAVARLQSDLAQQEGRLRAAHRDLAARQREAEQAQLVAETERRLLQERMRELAHYAVHLRRLRDRLQGAAGPAEAEQERLAQGFAELDAEKAQLEAVRAELAAEREQLAHLRVDPPRNGPATPDRGTRLRASENRLSSARRLLQQLAERRKAREERPV